MTFLPQENKVTGRTQICIRHNIVICSGTSITLVLADFMRKLQLKTYKTKQAMTLGNAVSAVGRKVATDL